MASDVSRLDHKIVAADLLAADIRIPVILCLAVQAAAMKVTGEKGAFVGKGICVRSIGSPVTDRFRTCAKVEEKGTVEYYPNDLMVIGGMALKLYDYVIRDIKKSRGLPSLKNILSKNTSDIDMVWWPRKDEIITINSRGIMELRDKFIEKIKEELQDTYSQPNIVTMILGYVENATSFATEVEAGHTSPIFGAIHIYIYFIITYSDNTKIKLEMCDIAIHDSGSSQQNANNTLQFMTEDPVYCNPLTEINRLAINPPYHINVPSIQKLVIQQLFAFKNLLALGSDKYLINYNRLRYIQSLLIPRNAYRANLLTVFGIKDAKANELVEHIKNGLLGYERQRQQQLAQYHQMQQEWLRQQQLFQLQQQLFLEQQQQQQQQRLRTSSTLHRPLPTSPTKPPTQSWSATNQRSTIGRKLNVNKQKNNQEKASRIQQVIQLAEKERQRRINSMTRRRINNKQERAARIQQVIQLAEEERKRRMNEAELKSKIEEAFRKKKPKKPNTFYTPNSTPFYTPFQSPRSVSPRSHGGRKTQKRKRCN